MFISLVIYLLGEFIYYIVFSCLPSFLQAEADCSKAIDLDKKVLSLSLSRSTPYRKAKHLYCIVYCLRSASYNHTILRYSVLAIEIFAFYFHGVTTWLCNYPLGKFCRVVVVFLLLKQN